MTAECVSTQHGRVPLFRAPSGASHRLGVTVTPEMAHEAAGSTHVQASPGHKFSAPVGELHGARARHPGCSRCPVLNSDHPSPPTDSLLLLRHLLFRCSVTSHAGTGEGRGVWRPGLRGRRSKLRAGRQRSRPRSARELCGLSILECG